MRTLKLRPKVIKLIRHFRCKDFRGLARRLYSCPVKPGVRALGQYLYVSPTAIWHALGGKKKHPHGGWYRTMKNILQDLKTYVETSTVDKQMLDYSPTLRQFIEHSGGVEQAQQALKALSHDHTRTVVAKMIVAECGMVHADAQYVSDWCAQLGLQNLQFKTHTLTVRSPRTTIRKRKKRIDPPEIGVAVPASWQKMMDEQHATAKDIAILMWRRYRATRPVVQKLGLKTTDELEELLRSIDPLFGVDDLQRMT